MLTDWACDALCPVRSEQRGTAELSRQEFGELVCLSLCSPSLLAVERSVLHQCASQHEDCGHGEDRGMSETHVVSHGGLQ